MKVGIDAKRIFSNGTGLGVYGRNLIEGLQSLNTCNHYLLFTPEKESTCFETKNLASNFEIVERNSVSSYFWRTFSIAKQIKANKLDIYHGLSNELPFNIHKTKVKSIVDIHDLCFLHYPSDYGIFDKQIFFYKSRRAAHQADKIIATSEATKRDIQEYFSISADKIEVIYQSCHPRFYKKLSQEDLKTVTNKLKLPTNYVLSVGTIQGRKNQTNIVKALALIPQMERPELLLVGNGGSKLKDLLSLAKDLKVKVDHRSNISDENLPAIYQLASLFIYPSFVEGFGIPVLEAMASGVPVITSEHTSMAEIINNEENLCNPHRITEISSKIQSFLMKNNEQNTSINYQRALEFSQEIFAKKVLNLYKAL